MESVVKVAESLHDHLVKLREEGQVPRSLLIARHWNEVIIHSRGHPIDANRFANDFRVLVEGHLKESHPGFFAIPEKIPHLSESQQNKHSALRFTIYPIGE